MSKIDHNIAADSRFTRQPVTTNKHSSAEIVKGDAKKLDNHHINLKDTLALKNQAIIGMKLVYQSVSTKLSSSNVLTPIVGFDDNKALEKAKDDSLFDFEQVAETVMSFVSSSIYAAKERGATNEELESMLEQASLGVNQGIDEAIAELDDLNLLDESLSEGIEKSRSLISQGLDKLNQQLFPSQIDEEPSDINQLSNYSSELLTSLSASSELSITTADGDLVTISFSDYQSHQETGRYSIGSLGEKKGKNEQLILQTSSASYREISFAYSIEGELDDEEKAAIGALIEDVNKLQKEFFNGDINKAFEQALTLGFNEEQLSSFSLDLQQTKTSYVSQTYSDVASFDDSTDKSLMRHLKPVLDFVDQFKALKERADNSLNQEQQSFSKLLNTVFEVEFGKNDELLKEFSTFINKLA